MAKFTPGLSFSKAFGRSTERPVIRGQSNVLAGVQFGVESGTAYFIDGVYYPGSIQSLDMNDIARVEVIKGPQSALYGRNTYAGAINFITKDAPEEFSGMAKARVGTNGYYQFSASMGAPIGDTLAWRFNLSSDEYDGEYTNQVTGQKVGQESTLNISGVLDWTPTSNFDLRLRGMYTETDDGPLPLFLQSAEADNCMPGYRSLSSWPMSDSSNTNQYYCGVIQPGQVALNTAPDADGVPNTIPGVPTDATYPNFSGVPVLPPFDNGPYSLAQGIAFNGIETTETIFQLSSGYRFGDSGYELKLLGGYRDSEEWFGYDSDHSSVNLMNPLLGDESFFANTTRSDFEEYSVELKIASPQTERFRWMAGLFYYDQTIDDFDITFADPTGANTPTGVRTVENQAIFGLAEYDITDKLSLSVEGRYQEETKTDSAATQTPEIEYNKFTPRVTLDYALDGGGTIYATFAQGVKPGGINGAEGEEVGMATYDQEESDNFEIGYKTPLFDGAWTFASAAYFIDASNVQVTSAIATPSGAVNSVASNQGAGEIFGIELELNGAWNENWSGGASYSWTDTEFTEGCDADEWTLTSGGGVYDNDAMTGTDFTTDFGISAPASCDISGRQFPLTSEHQASGFVRYDQPVFGDKNLFWTTSLSYESSKFVQVHNLAETGDATLLGMRAGLEAGAWTFAVYGDNILDEDSITMATRWLQIPYFTLASQNAAPAGASTGAPRAYFGSLRRGAQFGAEINFRF